MSSAPGKLDKSNSVEYYKWLLFCFFGMVSSLTLYGVMLEYATSGKRKLHEISFMFVTCTVYTITAYFARWILNEESSKIPKQQMLVLSLTSMLSTYTSVRSLRYVIYPVQVLFKSCKPVPVMIFGVILGKSYPVQKYVNVGIITMGVALFMSGSSSAKPGTDSVEGATLAGAMFLVISLCFDGATGAYEDKLMSNDHIGPFDLMYNMQFGKALISFLILVTTNQLHHTIQTLQDGGFMLIVLGVAGALGQVFVYVTISKFGALNCALIGLARKMLTLLLSFLLYSHTMNGIQTIGMCLAVTSMVANFYQKGGAKKATQCDRIDASTSEVEPLMDEVVEKTVSPFPSDRPAIRMNLDDVMQSPDSTFGKPVVEVDFHDLLNHTDISEASMDLLNVSDDTEDLEEGTV